MKKADNQLLVIFGASGDLTSRKLLPSLFELYVRGLLPDRFCILGAARTAYGDEEFRAEQHTHILEAQKGKTYDEGLIDDFLENVYYLAFDSTNADEYYKLRERIEFLQEKHDLPDKIIYYLATPPVMYEIVPQCLLESGLNKTESPDGFRRIIVEKPFGTSLESARQLNDHYDISSMRRRFIVSTIIWGKRPCRISWYCVSRMVFSSHCGTIIISIPSRSALLRPWGWRIEGNIMMEPGRCGI